MSKTTVSDANVTAEAPTGSSPRVEARRADTREEILDAAWELARQDGFAGLSLRKLAEAVGMRAPSLYAYFDGKDAILDGMFARGFEEFDARISLELGTPAPEHARSLLRGAARAFIAFANDDPVRHQLLFQTAIPGWQPSPEAYAASQRVYARMVDLFAEVGLTDPAAIDMWTAMATGLANQQVANDPGGDRWLRLADDAVDMFLAHHLPTG